MPQPSTTKTNAPDFAALLEQATIEPSKLSAAYTAFHNYSFGNMLLAMFQCEARGIPLGPIATYPRWRGLGRHVRKGEKAIELCQPMTCKRRQTEATDAPEQDGETSRGYLSSSVVHDRPNRRRTIHGRSADGLGPRPRDRRPRRHLDRFRLPRRELPGVCARPHDCDQPCRRRPAENDVSRTGAHPHRPRRRGRDARRRPDPARHSRT